MRERNPTVTVWSEEMRHRALALYVEEGPDEAARQTEVPVRTIYRWAASEGVATTAISEKTQAATSIARARALLNRVELHGLLLEQAVKALHSMDELQPHKVTVIEGKTRSESFEMIPAAATDKKELALTAAVLIDKFRLEAGEATTRGEVTQFRDYNDHERRDLSAALDSFLEGTAGDRAQADSAEVRQ